MQDIQTRDVRTVALKNCQNLGGRFYLIKFHFRNIFFEKVYFENVSKFEKNRRFFYQK